MPTTSRRQWFAFLVVIGLAVAAFVGALGLLASVLFTSCACTGI